MYHVRHSTVMTEFSDEIVVFQYSRSTLTPQSLLILSISYQGSLGKVIPVHFLPIGLIHFHAEFIWSGNRSRMITIISVRNLFLSVSSIALCAHLGQGVTRMVVAILNVSLPQRRNFVDERFLHRRNERKIERSVFVRER
jgi:hypothetical protein